MLSYRVYVSDESPRCEAVTLFHLSLMTFDHLGEEAAPKEALVFVLFALPRFFLNVPEYTDIK